MSPRVVDVDIWTTSGLAGGWQHVLSGSDATFIPSPAAHDVTAPLPYETYSIEVQHPAEPEITVDSPPDNDGIQRALLSVLQFELEPDEPSDADLSDRRGLQF